MDTKVDGLDLQVGGQKGDFRPEVVKRATLMVQTVLEAANMRGRWFYIITGPSESLPNPSQYSMEIRQASEVLTNMVNVVVRSSLIRGGELIGMLKLPPNVHCRQLVESLNLCVSVFNQSGWRGILDPEAREQAFDVGRPAVVTPLKQTMRAARRSEDDDALPPPRAKQTVDGKTMIQRLRDDALARGQLDLPVRPASRPKSSGVVARTQPLREVSSPQTRVVTREVIVPTGFPATPSGPVPAQTRKEAEMPTEAHDAKLAQFLLQVLGQPNLRNGVFTGKGITKFSHPIFTEKPEGWHRRILLSELIAKGWIRFLGQSEYQVEQSFVDEHGLSWSSILEPRYHQALTSMGRSPMATHLSRKASNHCLLSRQRLRRRSRIRYSVNSGADKMQSQLFGANYRLPKLIWRNST